MNIPNVAPDIEMSTKVIYSFKLEFHQGAGEIVDYSKTLTSPPGTPMIRWYLQHGFRLTAVCVLLLVATLLI